MIIKFSFLGSIALIAFSYCGFLIANKITRFGASATSLAAIAVIIFFLNLIPTIGILVAYVTQYFMLKKINPRGPILSNMLITIIATVLIAGAFFEMSDDNSWVLNEFYE